MKVKSPIFKNLFKDFSVGNVLLQSLRHFTCACASLETVDFARIFRPFVVSWNMSLKFGQNPPIQTLFNLFDNFSRGNHSTEKNKIFELWIKHLTPPNSHKQIKEKQKRIWGKWWLRVRSNQLHNGIIKVKTSDNQCFV